MKKMFLAVLTSLALCSYGFAQDDDDEYEEDEAPAKVVKKAAVEEDEEEEEDAAPAKKKEKKKKSSGGAFMGIGVDVAGMLAGETTFQLAFKLNDQMVLSALLSFVHHGETTRSMGGLEEGQKDNYTELAIGAGFDYFFMQKYLPVSAGGEFIFVSPHQIGEGEDALEANDDVDLMKLKINLLLGAQAELVQNLTLNAKVGLGFDYNSASSSAADASYLDFGLVTKVYLTWYMF